MPTTGIPAQLVAPYERATLGRYAQELILSLAFTFLASNPSLMTKPYLSLGDAIKAFLEKNGLEDQADIQRLIAEWDRLMGGPIAANTEKIWFADGVFFVRIQSPLWKSELQMARLKLRDTLNRELGRELIREVRIV
jgi:predicted nucleic acid-binding Zn ribbon protein